MRYRDLGNTELKENETGLGKGLSWSCAGSIWKISLEETRDEENTCGR